MLQFFVYFMVNYGGFYIICQFVDLTLPFEEDGSIAKTNLFEGLLGLSIQRVIVTL